MGNQRSSVANNFVFNRFSRRHLYIVFTYSSDLQVYYQKTPELSNRYQDRKLQINIPCTYFLLRAKSVMTDVVFVFEVHQPHRLRRNLFWEGKAFRRLSKADLFNYYFDTEVDREIFKRAARKCYFPSNQILLDVIDNHKHNHKPAKFSFSVSGVFLEQCEMFDKAVSYTHLRAHETDS